ncbi:MAG TPA: lipoprotein [Legionella sp.]|nr:lipoprotein [Legionella sp.]
MYQLRIILLASIMLGLLTACGQKGPLYLPAETVKKNTTS